jgi:hypothetical protein
LLKALALTGFQQTDEGDFTLYCCILAQNRPVICAEIYIEWAS